MADAAPIVFYYGPGSRYSYLASTRIDALRAATGRGVGWRPLFSGDLFRARGTDPFQGRPVSGQYHFAWRRFDAECWADYYGVPYREPAGVVVDPRVLALVATAASRLGRVEEVSRRLFEAYYVEGRSPLDAAACLALAAEGGAGPATVRAALDDPATAAAHEATIGEAVAAGVFGVPSFVVDGRVFFGNDRLPLVEHFALKAQAPAQRK